jgi:hypothetical protein
MELFMWQYITDDEDTQRLGAVLILNLSSMIQNANDTEEKRNVAKLLGSIPGRFSALHLCGPDTPFFHAIKGTFTLLMGKENRYRVRFHVGTSFS